MFIRHQTDRETTVDLFNLKSYIDGLSNFIRKCQCPMTIAIQGSWGSGKSSMMKMVEERIEKDAVCINFNTWQYSQFNLGDNLPIVFYQSLIEKMVVDKNQRIISDTFKKSIGPVMKNLAKVVSNSFMGGAFTGYLEQVMDAYDESKKEEKTMVQSIEALKSGFKEIVEQRCKEEKKERMVFFIDDLDRLPPQRAVELMEILKIILECDKCIFVLAIDYDVVSRGVRAKYGDDIGETKGRSFFDKIIQVPFSLPTGKYDINSYLGTLLKDGEVTKCLLNSEGKLSDELVELVRYSIGCNPRGIKRLVNTFTLLLYIENEQLGKGTKKNSLLFAALCMQLAYESVYNYMLEICEFRDKIEAFLQHFEDSLENVEGAEKEKMRIDEYSEAEKDQMTEFMRNFVSFVNMGYEQEMTAENGEFELSAGGYNELREVLKTTSVTVTKAPAGGSDGAVDTKLEDIFDVLNYTIYEKRKGAHIEEAVRTAVRRVAEEKAKTTGTVANAFTRRIGYTTDEFYTATDKFISGNTDELIERLIATNKNKKISPETIKAKFLSLSK